MLASPLKIVASKNPKVKKMVDTRKSQLKTIRTQLKKISTDERDRLKGLWDMHKELFSSSNDEELQVEVVPDTSIDEFFEK
jgi:small-conductance mechanosensitive channel